MATLGTNVLTLADWAKRLDPDGKVPMIVELLEQTNEVLLDMQWVEGNLPTGHRTTVRTGLPGIAWRLLNQGVQPSKSTTKSTYRYPTSSARNLKGAVHFPLLTKKRENVKDIDNDRIDFFGVFPLFTPEGNRDHETFSVVVCAVATGQQPTVHSVRVRYFLLRIRMPKEQGLQKAFDSVLPNDGTERAKMKRAASENLSIFERKELSPFGRLYLCWPGPFFGSSQSRHGSI